MEVSKKNSPTPTEVIDWLNDEGVLELDWDFPEDGDLFEAGLDSMAVMQLVVAVEDRFGIELGPGRPDQGESRHADDPGRADRLRTS